MPEYESREEPWVVLRGEYRKGRSDGQPLYHLVREGVEPELTCVRGLELLGIPGVDGKLICEIADVKRHVEIIPVDDISNLVILDHIVYNPPEDDERLP